MHIIKARGGLGPATYSLSKEYGSKIIGLYMAGSYAVTACTVETAKDVLKKSAFLGRPRTYFTYLRSMKTNKGNFKV